MTKKGACRLITRDIVKEGKEPYLRIFALISVHVVFRHGRYDALATTQQLICRVAWDTVPDAVTTESFPLVCA